MDLNYLGVERSTHMQGLARAFVADQAVFNPHEPHFTSDIENLPPQLVRERGRDCDHVVVLLSYIMQHKFLRDGLKGAMASLYTLRLPITILAQDARKKIDLDDPEDHVDRWPNTHLNDILDAGLGTYVYGHRYEPFGAPHLDVMEDGSTVCAEPTKSIAMCAHMTLR